MELSSWKIKEQLPLKKGAVIFLTGGKHVGKVGEIEDISEKKILFKLESKEIFETPDKNAFVIGEKKPRIEIN